MTEEIKQRKKLLLEAISKKDVSCLEVSWVMV